MVTRVPRVNIQREVVLVGEPDLTRKDFTLFGLDVVMVPEAFWVISRVEDGECKVQTDFSDPREFGKVFSHEFKDTVEVGFENGSVGDGCTVCVADGLGWVESCTCKDESGVLDGKAEDVAGVEEVLGDREDGC